MQIVSNFFIKEVELQKSKRYSSKLISHRQLRLDKFYDLSKVKKLSLAYPFLTIQHLQNLIPDLSYRKMNSWDEKGLISGWRKAQNTGWRFFSILDVIIIKMVSDLRRFGLKTTSIKTILKNLSAYRGERNITASIKRKKIIFLIDCRGRVFLCFKDYIPPKHFLSKNTSSPILILPFYKYLDEIIENIKNNNLIISKGG